MAEKENKLFEGKGEGGRWVTINGAHVFVDEGQSVEDAMQTTFNKNPKHDATRAKMAENNKQILENTKNINSKNSWEMSNKNIELYMQNKNHLAEIEEDENSVDKTASPITKEKNSEYEKRKQHFLAMSEDDRRLFKNLAHETMTNNPFQIKILRGMIAEPNCKESDKQRYQEKINLLQSKLKHAKLTYQVLEELEKS